MSEKVPKEKLQAEAMLDQSLAGLRNRMSDLTRLQLYGPQTDADKKFAQQVAGVMMAMLMMMDGELARGESDDDF